MKLWLNCKKYIHPICSGIGIVLSLLVVGIISAFFLQQIELRHQSETINPYQELKDVLFNPNDVWESYDWHYELYNLKDGSKRTIAECNYGSAVSYKLARWKDKYHLIVLAELKTPRKAKEVLVDIRHPKIPCDFSDWNLYSPSDQAKFKSKYVIIPYPIGRYTD